jgi:transcriptional regulator with XRE-family HTH domain
LQKWDMNTLGERIRYIREKVLGDITQAQLGAKIGVTGGAVGNWEHGKNAGLASKNLKALAALANVSIDWLLNGVGQPPPPKKPDGKEVIAELLASIGEARLLALRALPASDLAAAVREALVLTQSVAKLERRNRLQKSTPQAAATKAKKPGRPNQRS